MASLEPAAEPSLAQDSPTSTPPAAPSAAAEQEAPPQPQEPVPEAEKAAAEGEEAPGEEEEGECGFCLFMKAGGCRDTFVAWEECVEAAQKDGDDMVERCHEATANLKMCMDAHADYYAPVLRAEEAVNERAEADAAAAAAAAADDSAKDKGGEPATVSEIKEEEAVSQPAASSVPVAGEEAVAEKRSGCPIGRRHCRNTSGLRRPRRQEEVLGLYSEVLSLSRDAPPMLLPRHSSDPGV